MSDPASIALQAAQLAAPLVSEIVRAIGEGLTGERALAAALERMRSTPVHDSIAGAVRARLDALEVRPPTPSEATAMRAAADRAEHASAFHEPRHCPVCTGRTEAAELAAATEARVSHADLGVLRRALASRAATDEERAAGSRLLRWAGARLSGAIPMPVVLDTERPPPPNPFDEGAP